MNAIQLLKEDHDNVKELFKKFEDANKRTKQRILEQIINELETHTHLEEEIFYPAVMDGTEEEGQDMVYESIEEHRLVDFMIERIREVESDDESFESKVKVLQELVEHHIQDEEKEMFPLVKKQMKDELDRLGDEMSELKNDIKAESGQGKKRAAM